MSGVAHTALVHRRFFLAGAGAACLAPQAMAQPAEAAFPVKVAIGGELRALKDEVYDPAYVKLAYPGGDVADDRGVCTDTVIRAFLHAGVDLQVEVHEDMRANFSVYPKMWGLTKPDRNIDHRRVPNLETLFKRKGGAKTTSTNPADYLAGDIVSWRLSGSGLPHIAVVTRKKQGAQPLIAHNIGAGTQEEPVKGDLTLGENIADLGGLSVAFDAMNRYLSEHDEWKTRQIDGYEQAERFFMNWATGWRRNFKDEELKLRLETDSHAPAGFRAIGAPSNMGSFAAAFNCSVKDKMVRPAEEQVAIW